MSVLQQVLSDARKLATRLRDHDNSADTLLSQAQDMFKQVESMKEYCEEMNQLNEVANNRPRGQLIRSIQQENRYIRELQEENKELRLALEEQQTVMELIMSKYREQVAKLLTSSPDHLQSSHATAMQRKLGANIERVSEMVCVMRRAAQLDEHQTIEYQELLSTLARENRGLREMLQIAVKSGSVATPERHDAVTQTGVDDGCSSDTDTIKLNPNFGANSTHLGDSVQSPQDAERPPNNIQNATANASETQCKPSEVSLSPTKHDSPSHIKGEKQVDTQSQPSRSALSEGSLKS
ncbi:SIKE family [Trinorchestia longiramus]|nr:SIKE family [Trinorchestia longiramus]